MKEVVFCCALVVTMAVLPTAASGHPFVEPDADALAIELFSQPASYDRPTGDEFTILEGVGRCSRTRLRGIEIVLGWEVNRPQVEAHRVDISIFRDGFKTGRYLTSGELAASERELVFEAAEAGVYYYWRLLTETPEGWIVSGTDRVDAPTCPVDEVPQ